jgi:shikimate dehydrogenase
LINGDTELIAHIGYPTHTFKSPMIYNPYFERTGINAVVMPMGCQAADYPGFLRAVFQLSNIRGALITMPHKVTTVGLVDVSSTTVKIAGACNAVRRLPDGRLQGDLFDGEGFVRGLRRKGFEPRGQRALVVGTGGVGSAIAASLAAAQPACLQLNDVNPAAAQGLAQRLRDHHPDVRVVVGPNDPADMDLVVNATPLGMNAGDPMPMNMDRLSAHTFVGEVVLKQHMTAFLQAAHKRGCPYQVGSDMLFEQIPAYLEFFGLPTTSPEQLRRWAQLGEPAPERIPA